MIEPAAAAYFADPFVLRLGDGSYVAYGSGPPADQAPQSPRAFEAMASTDLCEWEPLGGVLERLGPECGDEYWAPEVASIDGEYWMYYSVGHGIAGHHLRVARAATPRGPFIDVGVNLTPEESFAIDAHPFQDDDGSWYLFFARDVIAGERPGTHLAVARMISPTQLAGPATMVLEPNHDWQIYERNRAMYGGRLDWHTLEGPSVVRRGGRYWLTYSGGAWTGPGYAVSWAVAPHPLGPWTHAPDEAAPLLSTGIDGLIGPGHNSLCTAPDGADMIAFHAWNRAHTVRRMYVRSIEFTSRGPQIVPAGPVERSAQDRSTQ